MLNWIPQIWDRDENRINKLKRKGFEIKIIWQDMWNFYKMNLGFVNELLKYDI